MQAYGFPWPPMLDCDKFPLDNDMCITAQVKMMMMMMMMIMMMTLMMMMMMMMCPECEGIPGAELSRRQGDSAAQPAGQR